LVNTFYNSLIRGTNSETLAKVLDWILGQQRYDGKKSDKFLTQLRIVSEGYEKLVATPRGKQILAMGATQVVLKKTEQGRKEVRLQAGITALAKGDLTSLRNTEVCQSIPATIEKLLANDRESVAAAIIQNVVKGLTEKKHELRAQLALVLGGVAIKLARIKRWDWLEKLAPVCLAWIREDEKADKSLERHMLAMQSMMNHAWYSNNSDLAEHILDVFYYIRSGALSKKTVAVREFGRSYSGQKCRCGTSSWLPRTLFCETG